MNRPVRVLQLHSTFHRGGIESFLAQAISRMDPDRVRSDFAAFALAGSPEEQRFREFGCRLFALAGPRHPLAYVRRLGRLVRSHGPYDIVHSHLHHYGGFALPAAARAGVPTRIAHSHFDTRHLQRGPRRLYYRWMKGRIARHATAGLATSAAAAADMFGPDWQADRRWRVLYCGIDLAPFHEPVDVAELRTSLGIPADAFVLGHVGRICHQKNQPFVVRVAAEVAAAGRPVRLLMIGDGPDRPQVEALARELGLAERVVLTGLRGDVARLMRAMDVFVFPSRFEGLGLVVVEALAAGVPCVVSEAVPRDAAVVDSLVRFLPFDAPVSQWADAVGRAGRLPARRREEALALVEASPFNLEIAAAALERFYLDRADGSSDRSAPDRGPAS